MAKTERFNLRLTPQERKTIEKAAARLGISQAEAARQGVVAMAERIAKSGADANASQAEFIKRQPEWQGYTTRIISGALSYDEALAKCGQDIGMRLKSEAEEAKRRAEGFIWPALFGHSED